MALKKSQKSLKKWTKQDWDYAGEKGKSRYLPKSARKSLTKAEKAAGSSAKRKATRAGKQRAPYTKAEKAAVKRSK